MKILLQTSVISFIALICTQSAFAQVPVDPHNVYEQETEVSAYVHFDIDMDGMPNWWELFYGLDPTDPADAALDADGDRLPNLSEYLHGTNPRKKDTDGGGVTDYYEIELKKDPLNPKDDFRPDRFRAQPDQPDDVKGDSDGDGIPNVDEEIFGTNKHSIDTDGDGLNDYEELYIYKTNPLEADTDFDGINDFAELKTYLTNPLSKDSDFDGLFDAAELFTYKTNPTLWDTDNGGMSDFDEIQNESDPLNIEDDFQFAWIIYYGEKPNDLFKSLEYNKIDIYQGLNLTLEAKKPAGVKKMTVQFNEKGFSTEKELVKLKIISPEEPGLYLIELRLELDSGKEIKMTRYVEIKRRGAVIRKAHGLFNNVYNKISFFDDQIVTNASIDVFIYNEVTERLERFESDIFDLPNPQYTNDDGSFVIALHPGTYLFRIHKKEFGTKDILFDTEKYTLYSQTTYLTYNYDLILWGMIFIAIFTVVWFSLKLIDYLREVINKNIDERVQKEKVV